WHSEAAMNLDGESCRTKAEALAAKDRKMVEMGAGKALRNKPGRTTLANFLTQDREALSAKARATRSNHRIASDHAIAALGADFDVSRVTTVEADIIHTRILAAREINGKKYKAGSKATARKVIATLKAAWNRGIERERFTGNPFVAVRTGKPVAKRKRIFSLAE